MLGSDRALGIPRPEGYPVGAGASLGAGPRGGPGANIRPYAVKFGPLGGRRRAGGGRSAWRHSRGSRYDAVAGRGRSSPDPSRVGGALDGARPGAGFRLLVAEAWRDDGLA